jgi:hypothetical protein
MQQRNYNVEARAYLAITISGSKIDAAGLKFEKAAFIPVCEDVMASMILRSLNSSACQY